MNDVELLAYMGTDAWKWTEEFLRIRAELDAAADAEHRADEFGTMLGWFATAIEAGRSAVESPRAYQEFVDAYSGAILDVPW